MSEEIRNKNHEAEENVQEGKMPDETAKEVAGGFTSARARWIPDMKPVNQWTGNTTDR